MAAGETVKCTYENTNRGKIKIVKVAVPADGTSFAFTVKGGQSALNEAFSLKNGKSKVISNVKPGTGYVAAETLATGWWQKSVTCNGGSTGPGNIQVKPGKTTTCTFTNEKYAYLTVTKKTPAGYLDDLDAGGSHGIGAVLEGLDPPTSRRTEA